MLAIFVVLVLVLVQTLSVSNSFLGVLDQHNAFGEISRNVTSLTEKAVALNSLGRFDEAIAYLDKVLSIDPNNVLALINKGVSLDGLGRFEDEIKYYDKVYADDETISAELFNQTSVRMGDWVGIHDAQDANGVWKLFNLANDFGENNNVADQHPDIVQKMKAAYDKFAQDVGVVIPRGAAFAEAVTKDLPPVNAEKQSTVTINLGNMLVPGHNATQTTPKDAHPGI